MARIQCAKCPWKTSTDPNEIPNGYCVTKHKNLKGTIAESASIVGLGKPMRVFACHESEPGDEKACVGWMANQLGPGNNIPLRIALMSGRIDGDVRTVGPQHERFEDTLPEDE